MLNLINYYAIMKRIKEASRIKFYTGTRIRIFH